MLVAVASFATVIAVLVILTFRERPGAPICGKKSSEKEEGDNKTK